jgi:hypothetical protein
MSARKTAQVRLEPADELMHENTGESNFNESMYFNFFDAAQRRGGFLRLGNRPNEGHAEMTVCLYEPDHSVLFNYKRPEIHDNAGFEAGGARFTVETPFEKLHIGYAGKACRLARPLEMSDPKSAFQNNPFEEVRLDLAITGVGPMFGGERQGGASAHEMEFAKGHYEQHHRATGSLEIAGQRFEFDGLGLRDHSWGPRYWQAPAWYRWLTANLGDDLGFMASIVASKDGSETRGGFVHRGKELILVKDVTLETEWTGPERVHDRMRVVLTCVDGSRLEVEGRVLSLIPLRNRRAGQTTRISEGMTEWRHAGRRGHGLSEYLDQVS